MSSPFYVDGIESYYNGKNDGLDSNSVATALGRLVSLYASGEISEAEWTSGRAAANRRFEAAHKKLERARTELAKEVTRDYSALQGVTEEVWRALSSDEQHSVLRSLIDHVEVNPVGNPPRMRIFWR